MGAGLIPFCVNERKVHFLFHKTFSGRRAGYLARLYHRFTTAGVVKQPVARRTPVGPLNVVETTPARTFGPCDTPQDLFVALATYIGGKGGLINFGGGSHDGENYRQTAVREFVEETDTMFLASDLSRARRTPARITAQIPVITTLLERTLDTHPDWWCQRAPGSKNPPKDWRSFFVEVEHRDIDDINAQWAGDDGSRFKKPRELLWVPGTELKAIINTAPERLWKRVRQLIGVRETVAAILAAKEFSRQVSDSSVETSKSGS